MERIVHFAKTIGWLMIVPSLIFWLLVCQKLHCAVILGPLLGWPFGAAFGFILGLVLFWLIPSLLRLLYRIIRKLVVISVIILTTALVLWALYACFS